MRTMMKIKMDTEAGNRAIRDGSLPQLMQDTLGKLEPKAAYFGPENGVRRRSSFSTLRTPLNCRH
jgi:hypothetical protein